MVSEQPTRQMQKELRDAGWTMIRKDGRHAVYGCSCGSHTFALPESHKTISAGVVRKCRKAIEGCKR